MKSTILSCAAGVMVVLTAISGIAQTGDWPQWARNPQHTGATTAKGQAPSVKLADIVFDPFTSQEQAEQFGELLIHYQTPLVDGTKVLLEVKTGRYVSCQPPGSGHPFPCGPDAWNQQIWNERAFVWQSGALHKVWNFKSDWKPEPSANGLNGWEPVFHSAISHGAVFVPGAGGSIYKLNEGTGAVIAHYRPFGATDDPNKYVSGPLTVDKNGNIFYNVIDLDKKNPWTSDVLGAWLVRVSAQGKMAGVKYTKLVTGLPSRCTEGPCGSPRPAINVAPAISSDGKTVYTVARAHFDPDYGFVVAASTATLAPLWQTSLRDLIAPGIEGHISNETSSTPAVTPDGSILFGTTTDVSDRGYLFKLNASGHYLTSYNFGYDITPAIYPHDGTYSVILKDNHYSSNGPYYVTQLDANLVPEWQFQSPSNFEWCMNAPAVDSDGAVYANSEDGNVYVINQGGTLKGNIFLRQAVGAAYTPIAVGLDGKIYTENDGDMFVIGN